MIRIENVEVHDVDRALSGRIGDFGGVKVIESRLVERDQILLVEHQAIVKSAEHLRWRLWLLGQRIEAQQEYARMLAAFEARLGLA